MTTFTINGTIYETNEKGNYFYKSTGKMDKKGNPVMMRIPRHVFEQAFDQYVKEAADVAEAREPMDWEREADAEYEERLQKQAESDKAAEEAINKKTPRKDLHKAIDKVVSKEMKKTRRSKDVAFEYCPNGTDTITLTARQVQFLKLLPKTCFWKEGVESTLWCDCIAEDIGWNPMSAGAMISTFREKKLVVVGRDESCKGKPKFMTLTEMGKQVATELGLN